MHNPNLSVRTSTKEEAKEMVSVDDLLDHTWHYDCVVSPTFHQKAYASKPSLHPNTVKVPPPPTEYVSLASFINSSTNTSSNGRDNTLRLNSYSTFSAPSPSSSSSSSASFSFAYAKAQSKSSSRHDHSQCNMASRERDSRKNHADPSRISFYAGFLTVD